MCLFIFLFHQNFMRSAMPKNSEKILTLRKKILHLYTDLLLTPSTYLCKDCYNCALELLVRSTNNEFTTDNEVTDNIVDIDEDFLPSILIHNIRKNLIRKKSIENA